MTSFARPLIGVALSALAPALAAQSTPPLPSAQRWFAAVRPLYSGDRAREIVAFMDHYWRWPGNAGFNATINRVAHELEQAGYAPERPGGSMPRLTYRIERHPLSVPTWEPEDASVSIVGRREPVLRFETNRNMLAINSYATPDSGVEANLVDAGRGTPAELDRASVAGKIVLADAGVGPLFEQAVRRRGAVGVLAYAIAGYTQPSVNTHSIQFSPIPLDTGRRAWGILLSYAAREELHRALAAGPVRVRVVVRAKLYPSEQRTLVAEVHGGDAAEERFVFSAHVQEPGANDNASGVGTLAEMARVAASLVRDGTLAPRRTITFIWGNETEAPREFLADDPARARGVKWGVSLDMVGENTALTGGTFLIEKMPDPSAVWTRGDDHHTEWGGKPLKVEDLRAHFLNDFVLHRCLEQAATTGWVVRTNPFEGGSDHDAFLEAKKPGLLLWHFTDKFYHTDGDRLDKVSASEMRNVGVSALVAALTLVTADAATAREIAAELERAAVARLDAELALSQKALAAGGDRARETLILRTWTDWYRDALRTVAEVEPGGASPQTRQAIDAAVARAERAGADRIARLAH